jgi:hypothetical protein
MVRVRNSPTHHATSVRRSLKFDDSDSTSIKQPIHRKFLLFSPPKAARTKEIKIDKKIND